MMGNRIAIVKLTSLGDVIHTLPLAAAIHDHRPGACVIWIVEEREQVLLRDNPVVDEIVVMPLRRWRRWALGGRIVRVVREIGEVKARLRALEVDVTIDVQGWTHKTSPIVALTRAPMRIGFGRTHARRPWSTLFTTVHVTPPPEAAHVVDQNLALLQPLGIAAAARFVLPEWPDAERRVEEWMAAQGCGPGAPIVLLPSTRGRRKFWPARAYAALAQRLASATGAMLVLAGSPGERRLLDEIQGRAAGAALRSYAPEPVTDLARFLRRAALVIGNDTGPLHLAAMAGVPAIGLFGPTRGARNGPYGPSGTYIQSPTKRMSDISVDSVFAAASRVLAAQPLHP
jgi:lipopolysaccharide heptosyltransferase I